VCKGETGRERERERRKRRNKQKERKQNAINRQEKIL
jgi:hypothetical protein